jgi:glycyl-tRNA synthetase beta chain
MPNTTVSASFLLEIGTEDLPARFLPSAIQQLKANAKTILKSHHIKFSHVITYGTPRRLAVIVDGVPLMQEDSSKEVFGPPKQAAFDKEGNPTKAALGFAKSQGVNVKNLILKAKDKGEYVVAVVEEKGVSVKELLPEVLHKIVLSLHLPKSMRWGNGTIRFIRPIRWLVSLFDRETINFEIDGIKSSNFTRGHRFLSPASFKITEIQSYKKLLGNNCVVVDHEERRAIITDKMKTLLAPFDEKPFPDEELLDTVTHLVEFPVPVLGSFSTEYLNLPKELLVTVMKGHQKYFAVEDTEGNLTNHFVVISNTSEENAETVRVGAERVIKARFEDARFYFEEDKKKPLFERLDELRKVTFQEKLGSLYDKTERVASMSKFLSEKVFPSQRDSLHRAALLAKTDLITGVVREFPELQGIMGKYYALHDSEDSAVAQALEEQYLPSHSGGRLPQSEVGSLLSIADKLDNITAFFSIGVKPTGSEDPFALRRHALGIIAILLNNTYNINIKELVDKSLANLTNLKDFNEIEEQILQFFESRIEPVFSDQGYGHDLVQSILSLSLNVQLSNVKERLDAIQEFKEHKFYNDFLTAIKRVNNILPKKTVPECNPELIREEPEKQLKDHLDSVLSRLPDLLKDKKYAGAMDLFTSLTAPINSFFDSVLVMDKNEEIKQNRLSLLSDIWKTISTVADFSQLKETG